MERIRLVPQSLVALFMVTIFFPREARCQSDTVSLQQAIDAAEQKNLAIAVAEIGARKSSSRMNEVRAGRFPPLLFRSHLLYAPEPGYNEVVTNGGEYGVQFSTGIPLYDGGVRSATIDQAEIDVGRSAINVQRAKVEIGFQTRFIYYELTRSQGEFRIRQESVTRLQDYASLLVQMQQSGSASESDVLKARVDMNNAVIELETARRAVRKAAFQLNEAMGRPLSHAIATAPLPFPDTSAPPPASIEGNLDLQLLEHDQTSAGLDLAIAGAERLPTLALVADAGALGVHPSEFHRDLGYSFLLSLEVPIFTWGGTGQRIEQKELAQEALAIQVSLQRREIETRQRVAQEDVSLAVAALSSVARNAADAERNYLLSKARFAGGAGTTLDVLDAHRLLVQADIDYNNALFQYRTAEASLLRLSGQP